MIRWLALALVALCVVQAKIEDLSISVDDRHTFEIDSFGFDRSGGEFKMEVMNFELACVSGDFSCFSKTHWRDAKKAPTSGEDLKGTGWQVGFVLKKVDKLSLGVEVDADGKCLLDYTPDEETFVYRLDNRADWGGEAVKKLKHFTGAVKQAGNYHLLFANCEGDKTLTSFDVNLAMYNFDLNGDKVYLSAGEANMPTWYFVLTCCFGAQLFLWLGLMRKGRQNIHTIHHLMTVAIIIKIATLFFETIDTYEVKVTGTAHGWDVLFYIFNFLRGFFVFTLIVLMGTGWSYMKPFLTDKDRKIIYAVLGMQFIINIAMVVTNSWVPGHRGWVGWTDMLHLLDMICCCLVLFPIVWSIRHLKDAAVADGKARKNLERLRQFRKFYLAVVAYIYFTRIIVLLINVTVSFDYTWLGKVLYEVATLLFYGSSGWLFRPQQKNRYIPIGEDDLDDEDVALTQIESENLGDI